MTKRQKQYSLKDDILFKAIFSREGNEQYLIELYILTTAMVLEKYRNYKLPSNTEYYFIELNKFRKQNVDMDNKLNQWLAFIDATDERRMNMAITRNKVIGKAKVEYEYLTGEEAQRRLIELEEMWSMDRASEI